MRSIREGFYSIWWQLDRLWRGIAPSWMRGPRLLAPSARMAAGRSGRKPQLLNLLLDCFEPQRSFLEIGSSLGHTLEAVASEKRVGVDPFPQFASSPWLTPKGVCIYAVCSDEYFASVPSEKFDVVYLDGAHESVQTYIDLVNSFAVLKPSGVVVIDGVRPWDKPSSLPDLNTAVQEKKANGIAHDAWFGDVYKTVSFLIESHPELDVRIVGNLVGERYCQAVVKLVGNEKPTMIPNYSEMIRNIRWEDVFASDLEPMWDPKRELEVEPQNIAEWLLPRR